MNKMVLLLAGALAFGTSKMAVAHGDMHEMNAHEHMDDSMHGQHQAGAMADMKGFMVKKDIDGYTVSFHIMKAPEGQPHGGTHHLMVKIEKDGKPVDIMAANSKSAHPNGQSESKMMMKMGNWYMASYDFVHAGQHQVMVLFKTQDGAKHFGGINYPEQGKEQE